MFFYSFALLLALCLSVPVWGWRLLRRRNYRAGLPERLGRVPRRVLHFIAGRPVVWVHAVSVGETFAATRLLSELEAALPGYAIVVSTTTPTWQQVARERFGGDRVFHYPLDFAFAVRRYLRALRPSLLILLESELWPRMLHECHRQGVPVVVVNARMSDRSLPRYRRLRVLWQPFLQKVDLLLAQTEQDAARWREVGVPAERVRVTGNLKYDIASDRSAPLVQLLRRNLLSGTRTLVAGSTHEGEESALLEAYLAAAGASNLPTLLVLAPRHPERVQAVSDLVLGANLGRVYLSQWRSNPQPLADRSVLLVDTVGELATLYALGSGAFIGGSLLPFGGHNPLEAAQFGVPVAVGPYFQNFRSMVESMQAARAITVVQGNQLAMWCTACLASEGMGNQVTAGGARARAFYESQRGATARTLDALLPLVAVPRA